jgi:O-antigen/teichoic acid export membrane protein
MRSRQPVGSKAAAEPSLAANALFAWLTFAGRAGFAFVATALVARALGPSGRGEVSYVVNLVGLVVLVASAGTAAGLMHLRSLEHWTIVRMQTAGLATAVAFGAVVALVCVVAAFLGGGWSLTAVLMALLGGPLIALANSTHVVSLGDRLGVVAWTTLAGVSLYALGTGITFALGVMTVTNNIVLWAVCSVLPLGLMIWPGRVVTLDTQGIAGRAHDARRLIGLTLRTNVAAIAVLVIWRADVLIVQWRRGFEELGLYSVAVGTAEIVVALAVGIRSAVLPHQGSSDDERTVEVICSVTRVAAAGVAILALLVAASGPWGMGALFGAEYRQAYPALVFLLPGVVMLVLHYPIFDFLIGRGDIRSLTVMGLLGVSFNVVSNIIVLEHFSYAAASVTSSLSYAFVLAWCVITFCRRTGRSPAELLVLKRADLRSLRAQYESLRGRRGAGDGT